MFDLIGLVDNIDSTHQILQQQAVTVINRGLTFRNWLIGYYIAEYELKGADRADYGTSLMQELAKRVKHIKGLTSSQLYTCRSFYNTYPYFLDVIISSLQDSVREQIPILRTLSTKLQTIDNKSDKILRTLSIKLDNNNNENQILRSATAKSTDVVLVNSELGFSLPPEVLFSKLCFSHFLELLRITDPLKRMFYEIEAVKNCWSVRQLENAIDTLLCERTQLSTNKESLIKKIKNLPPTNPLEIIRNPLNLEFLGLQEKNEYSETDLEESIITHLQKFLIELGRGFCFEARQKRISFDNTHYYIDLVFYHRILKCHVLIDLKVGIFSHADSGQMSLYLNYYEMEEMGMGDNLPIGIILCADKKETLVKYATAKMDNQLFVSKYLLELPDPKQLEDFIKNELEKI